MANWGAGLTAVGEGLDTLGAAKEKTMEMEYRNRRDANLRRFQLDDQAREDRLTGEKRTYTEGREDVKLTQGDEAKGIGDSERAEEYRTAEDEKAAEKQKNALELVQAKLSAMQKSKGKMLTKSEYIQAGLKEIRTKHLGEIEISSGPAEDGTPRYPAARDMDMWRQVLAAEWDKNQASGTPMDSAEDLDPFDIFDD